MIKHEDENIYQEGHLDSETIGGLLGGRGRFARGGELCHPGFVFLYSIDMVGKGWR